MSEIARLIKELKNKGVGLSISGDDLEVSLFKDDIDEEVLDSIRKNKAGIKEYIQSLNTSFIYTNIPGILSGNSYSISSAQRRLWIMSQFEGSSVVYNIPGSTYLNQDIDIEYFKRAIDSTIERHEILRTVFKEDDTREIKQWILTREDLGFEIDYKDFRKEENKQELVQSYINEDSYKAFDLEKGPLLRAGLLQVEDEEYVFYYNMHHIISDGWSMEVLTKDVLSYYEAYKENKPPQLKELRIQYKDYSAWQLAQLEEESFKAHRNYWLTSLEGELPLLDLPGTKQRPRIKTHNGQGLSAYIDGATTGKLKKYSQENGGSLFMGILAAWNILMYRYTGQKEIIIGSPIAGREHADLEDQIGFYINPLALRNEIKPGENFDELFSSVKQNTLNAYSHQMYPFDRLVEELNLQRDTSRGAIFDISISYHNTSEVKEIGTLDDTIINKISDSGLLKVKNEIELHFQEQGNYLSFSLIYNTDIYDRETIERLMLHYKQLLAKLLENPEEKISQIDYLSEKERRELLVTFNDTQVEYPKDKTIVDLFEQQVAKTPNNIAVVVEEKELSYKALDELSNQLANYLQKNYQIEPDDLVGIQLDRSQWMVIAILGVLKAGGAYVPIDPEYPSSRKEYIIKDSSIKLLITEANFIHDIDYYEGDVFAIDVEFDSENYSSEKLSSTITSNDLAYVIYTSGSTGNPKGVMIEHTNLVHSTLARIRTYKETQIFLFLSSISFDSSVAGIFGTLIHGGQLVLTPMINGANVDRILEIIERNKISQLILVSSLYNLLLNELTDRFNTLKIVTVGGEACSEKLVELHQNSEHLRNCDLYNEYGPTECTVWSSYFKYNKADRFISTIGKPISNTQIHVLNQENKLQPIGVLGEICIGGAGLSRGYLNQEALTREKFIENPFKAGERLYKTGDLGRWLPDGNIEFIGRKDDQIKIRGYRIELGEIEHALRSHKEIEEAVVLSKENQNNEKELVAYITSKAQQNTSELRSYLKEILPEYMLPAYYVQLESLPLTSNGKIDKKSLPDPEGLGLASGVEYVAPRNAIEEKLVEIWQEVLQRKNIGIKDDFFELGGHSLSAVRLTSKIQKEYNIKLELAKIFEVTTIEKIAEFISITSWNYSTIDSEMDHFKI